MHRSTLKPALGAALFVPCLLLTACAPEAGLEGWRPPATAGTELLTLLHELPAAPAECVGACLLAEHLERER